MSKAKFKTVEAAAPDPLAPSPEFLEARALWAEVDAKRRKLIESRDGLQLAISITANPINSQRMPEGLRQKAHPYLKLARKRRAKALADSDEISIEIEDTAPDYFAASEGWHGAKRSETNRIGAHLQTGQRAAVRIMVKAVEDLSAAMAAERECRAELRRLAPLPESPNLPDLSSGLEVGCLSDWGGPAWRWARQIRKLQILED